MRPGLSPPAPRRCLSPRCPACRPKATRSDFVDYDPTQTDVQVLSELVGLHEDFVAPNYYVRGAITQLDSNVLQSSASAGVSIPFMDLAINGNQIVSVVSIDLNVGKLITRQILPGISASNSIAVVQSGKGADVGGLIGKAGLSLSVSLDKSEGFHQAVRNLDRTVDDRGPRQADPCAVLEVPEHRIDQCQLPHGGAQLVRLDGRGGA